MKNEKYYREFISKANEISGLKNLHLHFELTSSGVSVTNHKTKDSSEIIDFHTSSKEQLEKWINEMLDKKW